MNKAITGRVSRPGENKATGIVHDFFDYWKVYVTSINLTVLQLENGALPIYMR